MGRVTVSARFDDLRSGPGRSVRFAAPRDVLVAHRVEDVLDVIESAEAARAAGRWVAGFIAYEAAPAFDDALVVRDPTPGLPLVWFGVHDEPIQDTGWSARQAYDLGEWVAEIDAAQYGAAIDTVHHHIRHGETYQTNYSFRLEGRAVGDVDTMYRDLVHAQLGGWGALIRTGEHAVLSASPELFFRWDGRRLEARPMKGTTRRGRWSEEDRAYRRRLVESEKNRAENVMIVDLLRNDLGRVSEFGTVHVERLFTAEAYPTIWTLTSTIAARTRGEVGLTDVFRATFPCGSVTGAPKARTMALIADVEHSPRGVYCGAIGLLAPDDSGHPRAEFNVAIRTVVIDEVTGAATYGTGGGIVHDSESADEFDEAMLKAQVLTARRPIVGLIETMRWDPDAGIWLAERHLDRLRSSAEYFSIPYPGESIGAALAMLQGDETRVVRIELSPEGHATFETRPFHAGDGPVRLAIDDCPIDPDDVTLFHKTTHRARYEAAAARRPHADDVILVSPDGLATETTVGNLAARFGDLWVTPRLESGLLPGTYRAELLAHGRILEDDLPVDRLHRAGGLAVLNSVRGWRPAVLA